jgi:hypothetical protein
VRLTSQWCAIIVSDDAPPNIASVFGPFSKPDAIKFQQEFNSEYAGSSWHAIVRPLAHLQVCPQQGN